MISDLLTLDIHTRKFHNSVNLGAFCVTDVCEQQTPFFCRISSSLPSELMSPPQFWPLPPCPSSDLSCYLSGSHCWKPTSLEVLPLQTHCRQSPKGTHQHVNLTSRSSPSIIIGSGHCLLLPATEHLKFSYTVVAHVCSLTGLNNTLWQYTQPLFNTEELCELYSPPPTHIHLSPQSLALKKKYSEG